MPFLAPILLGALVAAGCAGFVLGGPRLTADALCSGIDRASYATFCSDYGEAREAFFRMDFATAARLARRAEENRPGYAEVNQLIEDAEAAVAAGDVGPYNFRLRSCPERVEGRTRNDLFQMLRCPQARLRLSADEQEILRDGREMLARHVNGDPVARELTRAVYVHVCTRVVTGGRRFDAAEVLGCLWHADQLDEQKLQRLLGGLIPTERTQVLAQVKRDAGELRKRADRAYPEGTPEREILYRLPAKVLEQHESHRRRYAAALSAVDRFHTKLREGDHGDCVERLEPLLSDWVRSSVKGPSKLPAIRARLGTGPGVELADTLARCHYFLDRPASAAALLLAIEDLFSPSTLPERIYLAQLDALREKPGLSEKVLLRPPEVPVDDVGRRWKQAEPELPSHVERIRGLVDSVERSRKQIEIRFRKTRLPGLPETTCEPTDRVARITREGTVIRLRACRSKSGRPETAQPDPVRVHDARGVEPGSYVEVLKTADGPAAVYLVATSPSLEKANLVRLADIVLR